MYFHFGSLIFIDKSILDSNLLQKQLSGDINAIWLLILIWHVYATIIVYIFSVILNNSSLYDPFWSVAPVPILIFKYGDGYTRY